MLQIRQLDALKKELERQLSIQADIYASKLKSIEERERAFIQSREIAVQIININKEIEKLILV